MQTFETRAGPERWARRLSWATALGVGLGVIGPFGSYGNGGAVERITYWTGLLWAGTLILGYSVGFAQGLAARQRLPRGFVAGAATLLACAPLAALVALVGRSMWPRHTARLGALDWYGQTLFVSAPLVAAVLWLEQRGDAPPVCAPTPAQSIVAPEPTHAATLPLRWRAEALCLQMEDHYLRVHHAGGSELFLMSMHRALGDIGDERGERVHRSWWVAREAVREVDQDGRTMTLVLQNGLRVPVARNRIAKLRERGWGRVEGL